MLIQSSQHTPLAADKAKTSVTPTTSSNGGVEARSLEAVAVPVSNAPSSLNSAKMSPATPPISSTFDSPPSGTHQHSQALFSLSTGPISVTGLLNSSSHIDLSVPGVSGQVNIIDFAGRDGFSIDSADRTNVSHGIGPQPYLDPQSRVQSVASIDGAAQQSSAVSEQDPEAVEPSEQPNPVLAEEQTADPDQAEQAQQFIETKALDALKRRDTLVRSHEHAHATVGGQYAQSPSFEFQLGSDGQRYAVSGEVQIDVSEVAGNPLATIAKMKQVYAAAMAPVDPSAADLQVAAEALNKINAAKQQLTQERLNQAPDIDDFDVFIDAQAIIDGVQLSKVPRNGIEGQVDEAGHVSPYQPDSGSVISTIIERINKSVTISDAMGNTSNQLNPNRQSDFGQSIDKATLAKRYMPEQTSSQSLTFMV